MFFLQDHMWRSIGRSELTKVLLLWLSYKIPFHWYLTFYQWYQKNICITPVSIHWNTDPFLFFNTNHKTLFSAYHLHVAAKVSEEYDRQASAAAKNSYYKRNYGKWPFVDRIMLKLKFTCKLKIEKKKLSSRFTLSFN